MIRLKITKTSKPYSSKEGYGIYDKGNLYFEDIEHAEAYLTQTYGKCKRRTMYIDGEDGQPIKVGRIYCFKLPSYIRNGRATLNQDWVEFRKDERMET
jgi:hypothetical protein